MLLCGIIRDALDEQSVIQNNQVMGKLVSIPCLILSPILHVNYILDFSLFSCWGTTGHAASLSLLKWSQPCVFFTEETQDLFKGLWQRGTEDAVVNKVAYWTDCSSLIKDPCPSWCGQDCRLWSGRPELRSHQNLFPVKFLYLVMG